MSPPLVEYSDFFLFGNLQEVGQEQDLTTLPPKQDSSSATKAPNSVSAGTYIMDGVPTNPKKLSVTQLHPISLT